jgi:predicted nucleotidyltransferase
MHPLIEQNRNELSELCRRFRVKRLDLFGSAANGTFDPLVSDLDFLVEFEEMPDGPYARSFLGLLTSLEDLFGRRIDLLTPGSIVRDRFRDEIHRTRQVVYG